MFVFGDHFWLIDALVDNSLFQYGLDRICLVRGHFGKLYFVVVPTTVMVVFNVGCLIFSIIQLSQAWNQHLRQSTFLDYVKFLGKMTAFQSLQWIFGIVYYFVSSPVVGLTFVCDGIENSAQTIIRPPVVSTSSSLSALSLA